MVSFHLIQRLKNKFADVTIYNWVTIIDKETIIDEYYIKRKIKNEDQEDYSRKVIKIMRSSLFQSRQKTHLNAETIIFRNFEISN